jgi:16S rRNA (guanine527-N7)-methyltransferase
MLDAVQHLDDVSRETLTRYEELIRKWNATIQLVSPSDLTSLRERHTKDSLNLTNVVPKGGVQRLVDLGSGGGLPGIIVAIVRPELQVRLIESDQRKAAFLRAAKRELSLANLEVHAERIESVPPMAADVVTARALAPLAKLLGLAALHGKPETVYLFPKGLRWRDEVAEARDAWSFDLESLEREGEWSGPILKVTDLRVKESGNG